MRATCSLAVVLVVLVLRGYSINAQNERLGNSSFTCQSLALMLRKSSGIQSALQKQLDSGKSKLPSSNAEAFKLKLMELYVRELRTAERTLIDFLHDFNDSLSGEYGVLSRLEKNCQDRLNSMRSAAVSLEEDYNYIIELEKEMMSVLNVNVSLGDRPRIIKGIFSEISHAADELEKKFQGDAFQLSKKLGGAALETVVKVADSNAEKGLAAGVHHHSDEDGRTVLIDSLSNQYVLSRARDITVPVEDVHFLYDLSYLLLLSFLMGTVCCTFKVPTLLGYTIAGMVLGPVGFDQIRSLVQVETVGELGVVFIVFMIGLEFSPEKLRRVWEISVKGGNLLFVFTILFITLLGLMVNIHPKHSMFFAACIAHSSTTLTFRFLEGAHLMPKQLLIITESEDEQLALTREAEPDVAGALIGIIVMQDLQRGLLMSLMPFFVESYPQASWGYTLFLFVKLVLGFIALLVLVRMLTTRVLDGLYRLLEVLINKTEAILLCSLAVCFLLLVAANALGAPIELGSFFAGIAIGAQRTQIVDQVRGFVEPLRDFFSIFFFASIGFHVFPTFMSEFSLIFVFTFIIVVLKLVIAVAVLGLFLGHCHTATWIVGVGLAHVSDFSFVLASRARRMGIISREVYLVILSVSALSILLSPLLWQLVLFSVKSPHWHHLKMSFVRLRLHFMKSS